jgi:hypothetical protein
MKTLPIVLPDSGYVVQVGTGRDDAPTLIVEQPDGKRLELELPRHAAAYLAGALAFAAGVNLA